MRTRRVAAWVAWAAWTCNTGFAGYSQKRAGFGPLPFSLRLEIAGANHLTWHRTPVLVIQAGRCRR